MRPTTRHFQGPANQAGEFQGRATHRVSRAHMTICYVSTHLHILSSFKRKQFETIQVFNDIREQQRSAVTQPPPEAQLLYKRISLEII